MRKRTGILILLTAVLAITGCKGSHSDVLSSAQNTVYVAADGSVSSIMVYGMENDKYQEELQAFVEEEIIKDYNERKGAGALSQNQEGAQKLPVALVSCEIKDGMGRLVFDYASAGDMIVFLDEDEKDDVNRLESMSMETATVENAGKMTLYRISDMSQIAWEDISGNGYQCLTIRGTGRIQTEKIPEYLGIGESTTAKMEGDSVLKLEQGTVCLLFQ